ncbi:MAG: HAMP domain-containing histidine kinase [Candidatus Omnitrophica bacterium]|nr:HAMP domain-containing histidine kinase [Candidatus Omnitrophota bacterium]
MKKQFDPQSFPRAVWLILGIVLAILVEFVDYITGPEIAFNIFYVLVIIYFVWYVGYRTGYVIAVLLSSASITINALTGHTYYSDLNNFVWSVAVRMALYLVIVVLAGRVHQALKKEAENNLKLKKANEEILALANVKSHFTAMVSHELRTPLTAIRESIRLVHGEMMGALNPEQKKFLGMAERNINRLTRLINDILDFSKLESGKRKFHFQEDDLNTLLQDSAKVYEPLALKSGLSIEIECDLSIPKLFFDADALSQVINNLLSNALKFTEKGSVAVGTRMKGPFVEIYVRDTGLGIEQKNIPRLFHAFEQVTLRDGKRPEGTGLGLAISKQIVDQHGGEIVVESEVGKGTTILVRLPLQAKLHCVEEIE